jgi:hypothetical protein
MEVRHKAFRPLAVKAAGSGGATRLVVATLGEADSDWDVTLPGFFGRQSVAVLPAHDWTHVPLGKGVITEQGNEAIVDIEWNLSIPAAEWWYSAIKFDLEHPPALQNWSYGFSVKAGGAWPGEFKGRHVQFLGPLADGSPGCQAFEVSPVLRGAGVGTRTLAAGDLSPEDAAAREYALLVQADFDRQISQELRAELEAAA